MSGLVRALRVLQPISVAAITLAGILVGLLGGCAYSIGTGDRRLPGGYRLIAIPVFKNYTHEVGVEVPFTNALIREVERAQIAKVVSKSDAQVVLEGVIDKIDYLVESQADCAPNTPQCLIPQGTILNTAYRVVASTTLTLKRLSDGAVLWREQFSGENRYAAPKIGLSGLNSANALYNHSARQENLASMAVDVMAEAHGRLTENF